MRGSIDRRGADSWRVRIYAGVVDGRKRYVTRTIRGTRQDAEDERARLLLEVGAGRHVGDPRTTVAELLDAWLRHVHGSLSPSTRIDYRSCIDVHILPALGERPIGQVRTAELDRFYRQMGDAVGAARVRRAHNILSAAMRQAVRWEWLGANPAVNASPPEVVEQEIDPPTPAEVAQMVDAVLDSDPQLALFIVLAVITGARRGELCGIQWGDVDLGAGELLIRRNVVQGRGGVGGLVEKDTKTHQSRRIALDAGTVARLRRHRAAARQRALELGLRVAATGYVFSDAVDSSVWWRPDTAGKRFARVRKAAGLRRVRLHDLRHAMATRMLAEGIDVKTVAGRGGWRRASTLLDRYAHFVPAADRAAADRLGELFGGS